MTRKMLNRAVETALKRGGNGGNGGALEPTETLLERHDRHRGWRVLFFEQDGDFNPGWLVFCVFCLLVIGINVVGFTAIEMHWEAWPLVVPLLTADVLCMWLATGLVADIARAKLILPVLAKGAGSIASAASPVSVAVGDSPHDDERDDADRAEGG